MNTTVNSFYIYNMLVCRPLRHHFVLAVSYGSARDSPDAHWPPTVRVAAPSARLIDISYTFALSSGSRPNV